MTYGFETGRFEIEYEPCDGGVCITGYSGRGSSLTIPEFVPVENEELPVVAVGKKAFLGCKGLRELNLPSSVKSFGDWAFARCDRLRVIRIPSMSVENRLRKELSFGRRMFDGCSAIERLCLSEEDDDLSYLCGALVGRMPSEFLLWEDDIGSPQWYERWDLALTGYILRPDHDGYSDKDNALCGEEDISYDGIGSVDGEMPGETFEYIKKVSMNKCFLCLTRCVHDSSLSEKNREIYAKYLKEHKKGQKIDTAWLTLIKECSDKLDFYWAYTELTEADAEEIQNMIGDVPEENAQVRAYLISMCHEDDSEDEDIFESLKLF